MRLPFKKARSLGFEMLALSLDIAVVARGAISGVSNIVRQVPSGGWAIRRRTQCRKPQMTDRSATVTP